MKDEIYGPFLQMAPEIPQPGMVLFYDTPIQAQDMADIREFLHSLRETTLSRAVHKKLTDLLEKYK